jgi:selenoprotein W-related protein
LADELLTKYAPLLERLTLLPSGGGRFEVMVGDDLLFSKKALGRHVNAGEISGLLEEKYGFVETPSE